MRKGFGKLQKISCVLLAISTLTSSLFFTACKQPTKPLKNDVSVLQGKENLVDPSRDGINVNTVVDYFVKNNQSEYSILLPENAGVNEVYAAEIILDNVYYVTNVKLPIVYEGTVASSKDKFISVGDTKAKDSAIKNVNYNELKY